jgi:hypothetical protein
MSNDEQRTTEQATHLFQTAALQLKNLLSSDAQTTTKLDECRIYPRASSMDDINDCPLTSNSKRLEPLFKFEPDLSQEDRFRACFIDCSCDCSVSHRRRWQQQRLHVFVSDDSIVVQANKVTYGRIQPTTDIGIFEKLLNNLKSSQYNVSCDCRCGDNQQRSFSFRYSAGQQKRT